MNFCFFLIVLGFGDGVWARQGQGKLLDNEPCIGINGKEGICLFEPDCERKNGHNIGSCAKGCNYVLLNIQ